MVVDEGVGIYIVERTTARIFDIDSRLPSTMPVANILFGERIGALLNVEHALTAFGSELSCQSKHVAVVLAEKYAL